MRNNIRYKDCLEIINPDYIIGIYKKIKDDKLRIVVLTNSIVNVGVNSGQILNVYSTYYINDENKPIFTNFTVKKIIDLICDVNNKGKFCKGYRNEKIYILNELEINDFKKIFNPYEIYK